MLNNHYATLGLDRNCTLAQIRTAYHLLAREHHPDLNPGCTDSLRQTQKLNLAYEVLSDAKKRRDHDRELDAAQKETLAQMGRFERNISQEVHLRIEDFFRGASLEVRVNDAGNPDGPEIYQLIVPPDSAPGTRIKIPRDGTFRGGFVIVRLCALPGFRFKVRGSDLRGELRISAQRAAQGGVEFISGINGSHVRVQIPARVKRGEVLRVANEGLPRTRGGRGDLLVKIVYRPEVRITRSTRK